MAQKKVRLALATGSAATAAFFAGKYYERKTTTQNLNIIPNHSFPIFGLMSAEATSKPDILKTSFISSIDKIKSISRKLITINFASIQAASPITDPSTGTDVTIRPHATRISQIMKYGFPSLDNVISYNDFVLSYDKRNRVAHWVFEHLTAESFSHKNDVDRSKCKFTEDNHIHHFFRASNADYKGSGYDRGHLAAAGNHKSCQNHIEETFFLSNMAPQVGKGFNRDSWNRLEKYVRKLTKIYPNVYCCTGPLYLPHKDQATGKMFVKYEVIGSNHVAVPTHFFKVVVGEKPDGALEMECYVMENTVIDDSIDLKCFLVPPNTIERASGLLFFDKITRSKFSKINGKKT